MASSDEPTVSVASHSAINHITDYRKPSTEEEIHDFVDALRRSKGELDVARQQFDNVNDPLLIDHVVFRLGAAERHFNYLFQLARKLELDVGGIRWDWWDED